MDGLRGEWADGAAMRPLSTRKSNHTGVIELKQLLPVQTDIGIYESYSYSQAPSITQWPGRVGNTKIRLQTCNTLAA
jgi:hypothetical protein